MTTILMRHPEGPDRDALAAYMRRCGFQIEASGAAGSSEPDAIILHESLAPAFERDRDSETPVLVIGTTVSLEGWSAVRVPEPYFLDEVVDGVRSVLLSSISRGGGESRPPPRREPPQDAAPRAFEGGLILRGLAHALNNPLSAASGWLQILAADPGRDDHHNRALAQIRQELLRIETLLRAVALIGGRASSLRAPLPLGSLLAERVNRLAAEGLPVNFDREPGFDPVVLGDPMAFGLMLDLLFESFLDDRTRVHRMEVRLESAERATICTISESAGLFPLGLDPGDLGMLLRDTRHGRALGIALAVRLIEDGMGGTVDIESDGMSGSSLGFRIPDVQSGPEAPRIPEAP